MTLCLNLPYIAFVAIVSTVGLAFVGWQINSQVYRQRSQGLPISSSWTWIGMDIFLLVCAAGLYWKIYADSKTTIDEVGISRPSFSGATYIAWENITKIKVFGGFGFHIYSGKAEIVLSP